MSEIIEPSGTAPEGVKATKATAVVYPYSKSELVVIQRKIKKTVLPEIGVMDETARDYSLAIGASFAGANSGVLLGRTILTAQQERDWMPRIVGVQPTHQEWDRVLNDYWNNLNVKIPYDGLSLEVGMTYKSETEFEPIKPADYVLYQYCLKYPQVANSISEVNNSNKIRFYLTKESYVQDELLRTKKLRDRAFVVRLELEGDVEKMKSLIILSGNPLPRKLEEQQLLLAKIQETEPSKFLELTKDKKLLEKAFVERLIKVNIFTRPINSTLVMYDGAIIGSNLEEAAAWLAMPANSEVLLSSRQQLELREF